MARSHHWQLMVGALLALVTVGCSQVGNAATSASSAPEIGDAFWKHWGDGRAELAGYDLQIKRYGELRRGVAVTVFVTETFSLGERVKADVPRSAVGGALPVMKLNLIKDFQTGIYDYNVMTSSFVGLARAGKRGVGEPTKVSFSSQEWCGHVYHQLLFDDASIRETSHSYFGGEADQAKRMDYPREALVEDAMLHWARGLAAPVLDRGETKTIPFLPSLEHARLEHQPLVWTRATLSRGKQSIERVTPAGSFKVERYTVDIEDGRSWSFEVQVEPPRLIVAWSNSRGERAELKGATRLKYWELNNLGGEAYLEKLGLRSRASVP